MPSLFTCSPSLVASGETFKSPSTATNRRDVNYWLILCREPALLKLFLRSTGTQSLQPWARKRRI